MRDFTLRWMVVSVESVDVFGHFRTMTRASFSLRLRSASFSAADSSFSFSSLDGFSLRAASGAGPKVDSPAKAGRTRPDNRSHTIIHRYICLLRVRSRESMRTRPHLQLVVVPMMLQL